MSRLLSRLAPLLALLPAVALASVPAGYQFSSILDAIPPGGEFRENFVTSQASLVTATNNNGHLIGFQVANDGRAYGFNIAFGTNPKMTAVMLDDFVALSAADAKCWWIFCNTEFAYGARLLADGSAVTAFANTPADATVLPGSLPLVRAPGHFVEENRNGIVASTQINENGQFGVLLHPAGIAILEDVPWLIAINDLAEPLVLAYGGQDGDCIVFGRGCPPPPPPTTGCVTDGTTDTHANIRGKGHWSHGKGRGYGHYKCRRNGGGRSTTGATTPVLEPVIADPLKGPLLIRLNADGSTMRHVFPASAVVDGVAVGLRNVFPLALSDTTAALRGDVVVGSTILDKRLLSCTFNPAALDADIDGVVDCVGGISLVGGSTGSIRLNTTIGFSLTNNGLLAGNHGYNSAGVGSAFVLSLTAAQPVPTLVSSLAPASAGWEIHAITDANQSGKLVGYGYRDCAALPQAFFLNPAATAPASNLRFGHGSFEWPARMATGETLAIRPTLGGGSGIYEFRTHVKAPGSSDWQLLTDWSADAGSWQAGSTTGDACFRIEARDASNASAVQQTVVRYAVVPAGSAPLDNTLEMLPTESTGLGILRLSGGDPALMTVLGASGGLLLVLLGALLRRRKPR